MAVPMGGGATHTICRAVIACCTCPGTAGQVLLPMESALSGLKLRRRAGHVQTAEAHFGDGRCS